MSSRKQVEIEFADVETQEGSSEDSCQTMMPAEKNEPNHDAKTVPNQRHVSAKPTKQTKTRKQLLQHIVKNTRKGVVNLERFRNDLIGLFGSRAAECVHALVAYKPRLERIPPDADRNPYLRSVATLTTEGELIVTPWSIRPPGSDKARVIQTNIALYAYIPSVDVPVSQAESPSPEADCHCLCCSEFVEPSMQVAAPNQDPGLEVMHEEVDWESLGDQHQMDTVTMERLRQNIKSVRKLNTQVVLSRLRTEYEVVMDELREWLGPQSRALDSPVHMIEVFTHHAPLAKKVTKDCNVSSIIIGLAHGQDLNRLRDRRMLLYLIAVTKPSHVWFSFPCGCWGPWSRFNLAKGGASEATVVKQRMEARRHLRAVSEAWQLQRLQGGHCHAENPLTSEAWSNIHIGEVFDVRIDMCSMGMRCPKTNMPVLKPTMIVTTMKELAKRLETCRCDHQHSHAHLDRG